jgi:uncharacterized membrane protein YjjP (DUF1212 family)
MDPTTPGGAKEDEATGLLLDLAEQLHLVQMPADAIDVVLRKVAHSLGASADFMLFQSYAASELRFAKSRRVEFRRIAFDPHWRVARTREVVELARSVVHGRLGISEARRELHRIGAAPSLYPAWAVVPAYGIYGTAVAARIGGNWMEVLVAGLVGITSGLTHLGTIHRRQVDLQKSFLAGVVGTTTVLALSRVLPPFNFPSALFGGVALLVPATLLTIGTHELASEALESGQLRLAYGLLRFAMLGAGITAVVKFWKLFLGDFTSPQVPHLPVWQVILILVVGGAALIVCLQARVKDAHWIIGAVLLAYSSQELTKHFFGKAGSPLIAALILGLAANLVSRRFTHFPAVIIVPGLLQLVPGFLGTESLLHLLKGEAGGDETFFQVILVALQIVIGLLLAGVMVKPRIAQA